MDLPQTVRIGCYDYSIERWETSRAAAANKYGEHSSLELVIRVDMTHGPQHAANTMLHEIIHAILYVGAFAEIESASEECITNLLANGMMQAMRDNPSLFSWINCQLHQSTPMASPTCEA